MSIPDVKMNVRTMSDTEIQELFEQAFASQIAEANNIDDPEIVCERTNPAGPVTVRVNIYGMAGTPTVSTYGKATEGDVSRVVIGRADKGKLAFYHVPNENRDLGGNEYQVVYQSQ